MYHIFELQDIIHHWFKKTWYSEIIGKLDMTALEIDFSLVIYQFDECKQ